MALSGHSADQRRWLTEMGHPLWRHADPEADRVQAAAAELERRSLWLVGGKGHVRFMLPEPFEDLADAARQRLRDLLRAAALRLAEPVADLPTPSAADTPVLELHSLGPLGAAERRALWSRLRRFRLSAGGEAES